MKKKASTVCHAVVEMINGSISQIILKTNKKAAEKIARDMCKENGVKEEDMCEDDWAVKVVTHLSID